METDTNFLAIYVVIGKRERCQNVEITSNLEQTSMSKRFSGVQ